MSATQAGTPSSLARSQSKGRVWIGRTLTGLIVLFILFDSIMKLVKERHVLQAAAELGYPPNAMVWIGLLLLTCSALYVIPRTAVLGGVLLTGYLGGAVASQVRVAHPFFECVFPIIFGILVWAGLFMREPRLGAFLAVRKESVFG